jgi:hypothetical protein
MEWQTAGAWPWSCIPPIEIGQRPRRMPMAACSQVWWTKPCKALLPERSNTTLERWERMDELERVTVYGFTASHRTLYIFYIFVLRPNVWSVAEISPRLPDRASVYDVLYMWWNKGTGEIRYLSMLYWRVHAGRLKFGSGWITVVFYRIPSIFSGCDVVRRSNGNGNPWGVCELRLVDWWRKHWWYQRICS